MPEPQQTPTNSVWESLVAGDPGPAVALFDSMMDGDFSHAAGGMLRDLADAVVGVDEFVENKSEQQQFLTAIESAMLYCLQDDQVHLQELIDEAKAK